MITRLRSTDFTTATISAITGPTLTSVQIASDGTYATILDDTAVNTSGGFIVVNGTGFVSGCQVYIDSTISTSVTFVSSTRVNVQVPALSAGTYVIYLVNPDGSMAIRINGLTYSAFPAWSTGSNFGEVSPFILVSLNASSDSNITYTLEDGSSLPPGITLQSNGTLSGTFSGTITTTYNFTIVATDVELQNTSRTFSVTIVVSDPFFKDTTLLLNSVTPVNSWITDASTNKFNLTVNGDSRPNKFSPYYNQWAVRFNSANTDHLALPFDSVNVGANNFTLEAWIFVFDRAAIYTVFNNQTNASTASGSSYGLTITQTNGFLESNWYVGGGTYTLTGTTAVPLNAWNHVALVRTGGTMSTYLNGVRQATRSDMSTNAINAGSATYQPYIGRNGNFYPFNGFISDFRIIIGSHPYDATSASLTVPNSRLTAVANTAILTCNSNRFVDNNTQAAAKTITVNNTPQITTFAPFTESDQNIGSGYFDGTGDDLSIATNTAFADLSGNFTIECWFYATSTSVMALAGTSVFNSSGYFIELNYSGAGRVSFVPAPFANRLETSSSVYSLNTWNHIAIVRSGTTVTIYLNGTSVVSGTRSVVANTQPLTIAQAGSGWDARYYFQGYISDFRIVKDTAIYTGNFTPPTASLSTVANTSLLTLQYHIGENNHRFVDESNHRHVVSRNGNITQGTFTPFNQNGFSIYSPGTGNGISKPAGFLTAFAGWGGRTRSFDAWIYKMDSGTNGVIASCYAAVAQNGRYIIRVNSTNNLQFIWTTGTGSETSISTTATVPICQWVYISVDVNSTTAANTTIYLGINGVVQTFTGNDLSTQTSIYTGSAFFMGPGYTQPPILGYVKDLRFSSIVRRTGSYLVPTTTIASDADTLILIGQDSRFKDNSSSNYTLTIGGTPTIQAFSPFNPSSSYSITTVGASAYFDGNGDYLVGNGRLSTSTSMNTFTVEGWLYPTSMANNYWIVGDMDATGATNVLSVRTGTTGDLVLYWYDGASKECYSSQGLIRVNQWNWFAIVVNNNAISMYVNSTTPSSLTGTTTLTNRTQTSNFALGQNNNSVTFLGYIGSLRWSSGIARTISAIPTAPYTADVNTRLLLNFTNGVMLDATSRNVLEAAGEARINSIQTKFGGSSLFFDGDNDYLVMPYSPIFNLGIGQFTIECWVNFTTLSGNRLIFDTYTSAATGGGYQLYWRGTGTSITFYANGVVVAQSSFTSHITNTWYHVAVTRDATNTVRIFIDGTSYASASYATAIDIATTARPAVGIQYATLTNDFHGYIDNLRITKGWARYTANFTAPASAFLQR
jgi:hypothetical protein